MSDAPVAKGPPQFRPLKRTAVAFDKKVAPSTAALTEDFSKINGIAFIGVPPEPLAKLAALPVQEARIGEGAALVEAVEGAKPSLVPQPKKERKVRAAPKIDLDALLAEGAEEAEASDGEASEASDSGSESGNDSEDSEDSEVEDPALKELMEHVEKKISTSNGEMVTPPVFVPENRRLFKPFLITTFKKYILPPQSDDPDPDACMASAKASSKEIKTFQYQGFVRDYLQRASPYRGLLVYHGLGSGKTCTSIAVAEALYAAGNRKIFIMTPASLSGNFRGEMMKCGYFAFQQENHWTFVPASVKEPGPELTFLLETLGLPIDWVRKIKGGWVPDPTLPSNWKTLEPGVQAIITEQIKRHIGSRFQFINYNGLLESRVREWACKSPHMFDGAVIIIDEIHNLIRTINNSNLEAFYKNEPLEPEYKAKYCMTGQKYRISYLVYRLLCNAVGAKIVGLSGTPIINYPQELGIIANVLSGDMRYASATVNPSADMLIVKAYMAKHPEVDLYDSKTADGTTSIRLTPVPSGYRKVVNPKTGELRGFVRDEDLAAEAPEMRRERDLPAWLARIEAGLKPLLKGVASVFGNVQYGVHQRLPDVEKPFIDTFINKETLSLKEPNNNVLKARLSGLISYYKAGKPELVARVTKDIIEQVEMSDRQLQQYTIVRNAEIKQEEDERKRGKKKAPPVKKVAKYEEIMKSQKGTFKIFSRASCNFVFPDEIPRPRPGDMGLAEAELGEAKDDEDDVIAEASEDEGEAPQVAAKPAAAMADPYLAAIQTALSSLRKRGNEFFSKDALKIYSPKFQKMLDNLDTALGPALIYSNFKTLEGLGIFGIALQFQKDYMKLDIVQEGGNWSLAPELLLPENINKKRFITYTGDDDALKRDMLKHIFNANWAKLPAGLLAQVKQISNDAADNIKGGIAQLFMITQSGAEGISLENVRQVHIMEPYWNYVRLEQVKGRAIRICSHKSLPFDERTVEVYTYISKFSEAQKAERRVDQTLLIKDMGLTTDQQILSVSDGKRKLADSLFSAMRDGAVDCDINKNENGEGIACYTFKEQSTVPLFNPNLEEDIIHSAATVRAEGAAAKKKAKK